MPSRQQFDSNESYNKWFRDYRQSNAEKLREYNRNYNKEWRKNNGYHNELNSKLKYPEKQKARSKLQYNVRIGRIKKLNCITCGSDKSQAHHDDYSKPLDVKWFCPLHHSQYEKSLVDKLPAK